jgi:hypothetical protein
MPKKRVEVTTNEARYHATQNYDLGAIRIAIPLCDGGIGSGPGKSSDPISVSQGVIGSSKVGEVEMEDVTKARFVEAAENLLKVHLDADGKVLDKKILQN